MFEAILQSIRKYDTIILHRHKNPDGDALGSQLGLAAALRDNYPHKQVFCVGDAAGRYAFMEGSEMDVVSDEIYTSALAIILDTPSRSMLSDERCLLAAHTARLDHHIFCEQLAVDEVIDNSYESCCGLVTEMAVEAGWQLSTRSATALYTGMVTDSGRFRYDSVSSKTFRLASVLMQQQINTAELYRRLYSDELSFIKLRARFVQKIELTSGGHAAFIYTTADEIRSFAADAHMLSRAMVNVMADIRGVDAWVSFTEAPEGVLAELRSSVCEVYPIAKKYGGGGHAKACGATLRDRTEAMSMLADIDALTEAQK